MKVLHVYRTYYPDPPGGIQQAIFEITRATKAHDIKSTIFTLSPTPQPKIIEREEATVVREKSYAAPASCDLGGLDSLTQFKHLAHDADIVHYHFPWPFQDVLHFLARHQKPSLMTYHSDIVRQKYLGAVYAPLMHLTLRQMTTLVATSPNYAATSPVLAHYKNKLEIIPLGLRDIASAPYDAQEEKKQLAALTINPDKPFVLALGVLRYYKGLHDLVTASSSIAAQIVIAGDGPQEAALKAQAQALQANNIIFTKRVNDAQKRALLRHASVFTLPSHLRSEAFGMVLVEAAMFSKPLVSCAIGSGMSYINQHGITGLEVAANAPEELASAITTLLGNPTLAQNFGRAARARYETLFSDVALGRAYAKLYQNVLNKIIS